MLPDRLLMDGVGIGMEERYRGRFHPLFHQQVDRPLQTFHIELAENFAVVADALVHLEDIASRHKRLGFVQVEIVWIVAFFPSDDQHVTETGGG